MINKLQSERIGRIEKLKGIIRKIGDKKIDEQEFIQQVISIMRVNRETAREYIKQAQYEIAHRI